jgi:hypothetical protein
MGRIGCSFFSEAEREWPNTEAAKTPTATKIMYIRIGTRPFHSRFGPVVITKGTLIG